MIRPTRRRPAPVTAAALLAVSLAAGALGPAAAAPAGRRELTVGTLRLRPCTDLRGAWCGRLRVPFDRDDRDAGTIPIGFEWYPASGRAAGTIVAMEGGPGYPSTGSRDDYLELFAPLRRSRNLLLVDNRGTGTSAVVRCTPLQRWRIADGNPEYLRRVAACGHQLDHTRPLPGGGFVHGSDLDGTANAARDLADVLAALRTGRVDLYGDSYGSRFAQTFAARYPGLLRSVTLDATWPVLGTDPFTSPPRRPCGSPSTWPAGAAWRARPPPPGGRWSGSPPSPSGSGVPRWSAGPASRAGPRPPGGSTSGPRSATPSGAGGTSPAPREPGCGRPLHRPGRPGGPAAAARRPLRR